MTDKFLIIGGGIRLEKAREAFVHDGYSCDIYKGDVPLKSAVDSADIILLGLPASRDDIYVDADEDIKVSLRDISMLCSKKKLLFGGRFSEKAKALFDIYSVRWADYALREEFEMLNAIPTAEGAIQIAMEEFPFTLHSSKTIVTGFGKVAEALAVRLRLLGSDCSVIARSPSARAHAESLGLKAYDFSCFPALAKDSQIIFNTVPAPVCGKEVLSRLSPAQGIIDLASKPGGVDLDAAKTFGANVIWALSLPGKVAPASAGQIIEKAACNLANELRI